MSDEVKYYPFKIGGVEQVHPNVHPGTPKYAAGIVVGNLAFLSGMTPQSTEDGSCLTVGVEVRSSPASTRCAPYSKRWAARWRTS